jgi:hypothetical protein
MATPIHIRARWHPSRWVALSFARYNRDAVARLKDALEVRAYDAESREWLIPEWALEDVADEFGVKISVSGQPPQQPQDSRYLVLSVHREAPNCVVKAAYKALAFELHPDRNHGATGEKMKQLNVAYQSISKERGL